MDPIDRLRATLRVRCVHLRTKSAYTGMPHRGERPNDLDTATWWCERTCEALGPDGSAAHPRRCDDAPSRACYERPLHPPGT